MTLFLLRHSYDVITSWMHLKSTLKEYLRSIVLYNSHQLVQYIAWYWNADTHPCPLPSILYSILLHLEKCEIFNFELVEPGIHEPNPLRSRTIRSSDLFGTGKFCVCSKIVDRMGHGRPSNRFQKTRSDILGLFFELGPTDDSLIPGSNLDQHWPKMVDSTQLTFSGKLSKSQITFANCFSACSGCILTFVLTSD